MKLNMEKNLKRIKKKKTKAVDHSSFLVQQVLILHRKHKWPIQIILSYIHENAGNIATRKQNDQTCRVFACLI